MVTFSGLASAAGDGCGSVECRISTRSGNIDGEEFVDLSQIVVFDSTIVGLASMTGQILIPVPVLGAFVGGVAGKFVASAIRQSLGESESELMGQLYAYEQSALSKLDQAYAAHLRRLDAYFGNLEQLARVSFDDTVNTNLRLGASTWFAETVGVPDWTHPSRDRRSGQIHRGVEHGPDS